MGQILRHHHNGQVRIDTTLLTDIEWVLSADEAAPRSVIAPLAAAVRAHQHAGHDPEADRELVEATLGAHIHPYLRLLEVDTLGKLRGWHRLRHGSVAVDAGQLSEIRNIFDLLTLSWTGCEDFADDLGRELGGWPDPILAAEKAFVEARLSAGQRCLRCEQCRFMVMRDRIDAILDKAGFEGGPYYQAYVAAERDPDPEATWSDVVVAPTLRLVAA